MSRFYGMIGYVDAFQTSPGVWDEVATEYPYYGDVLRNAFRAERTSDLNDEVKTSNQISIVADAYSLENFHSMRYVSWRGANWKIVDVREERPRLILTLGGVYNGRLARDTTTTPTPDSSGEDPWDS